VNSTLHFEVASVKPGTGFGQCGGPDKLQFTCKGTLNSLVGTAFGLKTYQTTLAATEGPSFDIIAKIPQEIADKGGTPAEIRARQMEMLRNLLIERFQIKYHFEKKEVQVYDLQVAKNGPKFKEAPPESSGENTAPNTGRPGAVGADGFPSIPVPPRNYILMQMLMTPRASKFLATGATMAQLADSLSRQVGSVPVTDNTGLTGKYDFTLLFTPPNAPMPPADVESSAPALFPAIQEQLGLKLEAKKASLDVFVLDHAEKSPTGN
jgi:uncharacterized protein (TIGR03435 family)